MSFEQPVEFKGRKNDAEDSPIVAIILVCVRSDEQRG